MNFETLSAKELAIYREGLADIPSIEIVEPLSALEASRREWGDRCRRLLATYDALAAERDRLREAAELVIAAYSMGHRKRYAALDTAISALRAALASGTPVDVE